MDGYCVWVDTIKKIASFHHVEQSDFMHFLQHETFMAYLHSGLSFSVRGTPATAVEDERGGGIWDYRGFHITKACMLALAEEITGRRELPLFPGTLYGMKKRPAACTASINW